MTALPNSHIIKVGIVTPDAAATARSFEAIFPVTEPPVTPAPPAFRTAPTWYYRGQQLPHAVDLIVANVFTGNFWFEVVQPPADPPNPWHDHLTAHGTSVMWTAIHIADGFEDTITQMQQLGYDTVWIEDKGYERYAYFDTLAALGLLVEVKEQQPR